ncbi:MAG: hypothetical protein ACOWWM_19510 [Desulfobacterales bacterium]
MMFERRKMVLPKTVEEAADLLMSDLSTDDMETFAQIDEDVFELIYNAVANILLEEFHIWTGNDELLRSCIDERAADAADTDPAYVILDRLRRKLREDEAGVYIITG